MRRAHDALQAPQTVSCKNCGEPVMPHRACPSCGQYKGRLVKDMEEEE